MLTASCNVSANAVLVCMSISKRTMSRRRSLGWSSSEPGASVRSSPGGSWRIQEVTCSAWFRCRVELGRPAQVRPNVERFVVNSKRLLLLSKGRVINLVAAEGNQPEVMALSFANQLLSILHVAKNHGRMERKVLPVPEKIDNQVAEYALDAMGISIDELTKEQRRYQEST